MKKYLWIITVPVLIIIGIAGWSFINKPTSIPINKVTPSVAQTMPTAIPTTLPSPITDFNISPIARVSPPSTQEKLVYANPSVTIDAFQTAIPEKKYSDLLDFMAPNVTFIKYGSSCCGLITKEQAIKEMEYLSGAANPWNFADNNPIAAQLATNDPDNFKDVFVGTSANNYAVGFVLNDEFLISKITLENY